MPNSFYTFFHQPEGAPFLHCIVQFSRNVKLKTWILTLPRNTKVGLFIAASHTCFV